MFMRLNSLVRACTSLALLKMPVAIATLGLIASPLVRADVTITTPPGLYVQPWGQPDSLNTPTYGQVIVPPAGNPILKSVTFRISNQNTEAIPFTAFVTHGMELKLLVQRCLPLVRSWHLQQVDC